MTHYDPLALLVALADFCRSHQGRKVWFDFDQNGSFLLIPSDEAGNFSGDVGFVIRRGDIFDLAITGMRLTDERNYFQRPASLLMECVYITLKYRFFEGTESTWNVALPEADMLAIVKAWLALPRAPAHVPVEMDIPNHQKIWQPPQWTRFNPRWKAGRYKARTWIR